MRYYRKYNRRRVYRKRTTGKRKYAKKKGGIRGLIKRIVNRKSETKVVQMVTGYSGVSLQKTATGLANNSFNAIPSIGTGTLDGQRIADRVDIQKWIMRFHFARTTGTNVSNSAISVRLVVYGLKDQQASVLGSTLSSVEASNFFRTGTSTGTANGYFGNDHMNPINHNRINVYADKKFVIGSNWCPTTTALTGAANGNPFQPAYKYITLNMAKHLKRLIYDENAVNPNLPTNKSLFYTIFVNYIDGVQGDDATQWVQFVCNQEISYKDA